MSVRTLFFASLAIFVAAPSANALVINGTNANDVLIGTADADTISGMDGNDIIEGLAGADILSGGAGADIFVFSADMPIDAIDVITDFSLSDGDKIAIGNLISFDPSGTGGSGLDSATDFIRILDNGIDSFVSLDADGGGDTFQFIFQILGVVGLTDEDALFENGDLILSADEIAAPEIPIPAAFPLFLAGLAGLGFISRKRRKAEA